MKEFVIFLLLHNTATNGQDIILQSEPMRLEQCETMAQSVWAIDWPAVPGARTVPDNGPVPVTDAACVPLSEWEAR